jgi:hypothetical protein
MMQRYLDRLADSIGFAVHDSTIIRLLSLLLSLLFLCFRTLCLFVCVSSLLPSSFITQMVLYFRVVSQSLHIIIQSGRIASSRKPSSVNGFFPWLSLVLDATYPDMHARASASSITNLLLPYTCRH